MPNPAAAPHADVARRGNTRVNTTAHHNDTPTWATAARGNVGLPSNVPAARLDSHMSPPRHSTTTVEGTPLNNAPASPARSHVGTFVVRTF